MLLLVSCLLSGYFSYLRQIPGYTIQDHSFRMNAGLFLMQGVLFFLLLFILWKGCSRFMAARFTLDYPRARSLDLMTYYPAFFLLLLPLAHSHYLTADDLFSRVRLFGIALLFVLVYLKIVNISIISREKPGFFSGAMDRFLSFSLKKKMIFLFLISLLVYNAGSVIMLTEGITLSGDEPHYVIISQSLLEDGDFDLSNNYAGHDYRKYMPPATRLDPHIAPRTGGKHSFHSPGLSILLLPFYALGSFFGGKVQLFIIRFGMSLFGALLGLQIFLFARKEWKKEKPAMGLWAVFSFTSPVFFHALHIYPEIVVTLFSLVIFRWLRFSSSLSRFQLLGMGLMLSLFVWLHAVKYVFILVPLFLYALWELVKKFRTGGEMVYFFIFPAGLFFLHMLFSHSLYGSLSPFAVSLTGAVPAAESMTYLKTLFTEISLSSRLETLAGYFFDQRDGLLFYAPVYLFVLLGMIEMLRRRRRDFFLLLFLSAPYVLFHAFLTQRASFAPHARPLVAVFWVAAVFLGYFLACRTKKIFSYLYKAAAFLSFLLVYLLLRNPWSLYQSTTYSEVEPAGRLFVLLSSLRFYLPDYLPSYLKRGIPNWTVNVIWMLVPLGFAALYLAVKKHDFRPGMKFHLACSSVVLVVFFGWLVLFPQTPLGDPVPAALPSQKKVTFYGLGRVARMVEPGQFRFPSDKREYVFYFTSWRKIDTLRIDFGSRKGDYFVSITLFDKEIHRGGVSGEMRSLTLTDPVFYPYKQTHLYRVGIYLERTSAVSMIEHPFVFNIK